MIYRYDDYYVSSMLSIVIVYIDMSKLKKYSTHRPTCDSESLMNLLRLPLTSIKKTLEPLNVTATTSLLDRNKPTRNHMGQV